MWTNISSQETLVNHFPLSKEENISAWCVFPLQDMPENVKKKVMWFFIENLEMWNRYFTKQKVQARGIGWEIKASESDNKGKVSYLMSKQKLRRLIDFKTTHSFITQRLVEMGSSSVKRIRYMPLEALNLKTLRKFLWLLGVPCPCSFVR